MIYTQFTYLVPRNICMGLSKSEGRLSLNIFILPDVEVPVISGTPSNQTVNTDASLPNATVSWTPPTASDNSGEAVTLTSDYESGDIFPIGTTTVTYIGTDSYGNTATSSFNVVVIGKYNSQFVNKEIKVCGMGTLFVLFYPCWVFFV